MGEPPEPVRVAGIPWKRPRRISDAASRSTREARLVTNMPPVWIGVGDIDPSFSEDVAYAEGPIAA